MRHKHLPFCFGLALLLSSAQLFGETAFVPESAVSLEYKLFKGKPRVRKEVGKDTVTVYTDVKDGDFTAKVLPVEEKYTCYFRRVDGDARSVMTGQLS